MPKEIAMCRIKREGIQFFKTDDEFMTILPNTTQPLQNSNYYKSI